MELSWGFITHFMNFGERSVKGSEWGHCPSESPGTEVASQCFTSITLPSQIRQQLPTHLIRNDFFPPLSETFSSFKKRHQECQYCCCEKKAKGTCDTKKNGWTFQCCT